ncbi:CHY zinc finger [Corynebacterium capitovis DSM 44611]|nr:CHY zinc finger [Corynebacterium capitovis DSM 44611]
MHGIDVDPQGRCVHWHSPVDVVANRCATCGKFYACHLCHEQLADHAFGRAASADLCVMCGACGAVMTGLEYGTSHSAANGAACPRCGHGFNPGCASHASIYFLFP